MNPDMSNKYEVNRYLHFGLVANPFALSDTSRDFSAVDLEVASQANALLGALVSASDQAHAKPVTVAKTGKMPTSYHNRAISRVEHSLATDEGLEVFHAYVLMFMMRLGRVRSTLQIVSERLVFRDFNKTLALYIDKVLAEPDENLVSYQVMGAEVLADYQARFAEDREQAVADVFGVAKIERRPELSEVADIRPSALDSNVDEEDSSPEIDGTIGDAPGSDMILADELLPDETVNRTILDYLVEYTGVHLSPVIARGLRVYQERGLTAVAAEFLITKAPRKTLAALVRLARVRFKKVVLIYDGFAGWAQTPPEIRSQIAGTLSELRWTLEDDAVVVMMLERDGVPELEEQFSSGSRVDWDFPGILTLQNEPDGIDVEMLDRWLAYAAAPGVAPLTVGDPVLSALLAESDGSLKAFVLAACVAIESAVERGATALDAEALEAGQSATWEETEAE